MNKTVNNENIGQFDAFFESASMGILIANKSGQIISANPFLIKLFGYQQGELKSQQVDLLIPNRFHQNHKLHMNGFAKKPISRPMGLGMSLYGIKKNKEEFPVEISLSNYLLNNEEYIVAFISDATEKVIETKKLKKSNEMLQASNDNFYKEIVAHYKEKEAVNKKLEEVLSYQDAILNNMSVMLFVMNKNGLITFSNKICDLTTGYTREELINQKSPLIFLDKQELDSCRSFVSQNFGLTIKEDIELLNLMVEKNLIREKECTIINKNGTLSHTLLTISAIKDNNNEINGYLGIAIDINKIKEAEDILISALAKEKELGQLKSRFISIASHEFKTPLSTILSSAFLAKKYTQTDEQPKRNKHFHRITTSVNLLSGILNDFLNVGKIEEGKIFVKIESIDIISLAEDLIKYMSVNMKRGQKILLNKSGNRVTFLDINLIRNILMNLLSNAIKYSFENSEVELTIDNNKNSTIIVVKDQGIGIPKEDHKHLTERFYRSSNVSNIPGTGLGLHIINRYVEELNGTMEIESEINIGTAVTIKLPNNPSLNSA